MPQSKMRNSSAIESSAVAPQLDQLLSTITEVSDQTLEVEYEST